MPDSNARATHRYNEGNAHLRASQYHAAIAAYDEALALAPDLASARYNRALALTRIGEPDEAIEDFRLAALAGFDEPFFYDAWIRHLVNRRGYRDALSVCDDAAIPALHRFRLEQGLDEALQESSFLLRAYAEAGIEIAPGSLPLRCALGDLLAGRFAPDPDLVAELLGATEAPSDLDPEWDWRVRYLLGALYGSVFLSPFETLDGRCGLVFDADHVSDHAFAVQSDGPEADALDAFILTRRPDLAEAPRERRFARFALTLFQDAARSLCAARRFRLVPARSADVHWAITEDLWRSLVEAALHLDDAEAFALAMGLVRTFNALTGLRGWFADGPADPAWCANRATECFGSEVAFDELTGDRGLILDWFVFEKASDTLAYGVYGPAQRTVGKERLAPDTVAALVGISLQWETPDALSRRADRGPDAIRRNLFRQLLAATEVPGEHYPEPIETLLSGPAGSRLDEVNRVLIVPYGYLHNVPFHMLRPVVERIEAGTLREIVYLPAASFARRLRERRPVVRREARYLFVGGGEGIAVDPELRVVRGLFPHVEILMEHSASPDAVMEALARADVAHFACHGGFDDERGCTYLQLPEGRLYPGDLLDAGGLDLDLVLLNACVTGVFGREARNSDAQIGLPTAFLLAGARQVIGALWPVNDDAALAFATRFLEGWYREPGASGASLAIRVQAEMRHQAAFADPFAWAAHAVFGDWR